MVPLGPQIVGATKPRVFRYHQAPPRVVGIPVPAKLPFCRGSSTPLLIKFRCAQVQALWSRRMSAEHESRHRLVLEPLLSRILVRKFPRGPLSLGLALVRSRVSCAILTSLLLRSSPMLKLTFSPVVSFSVPLGVLCPLPCMVKFTALSFRFTALPLKTCLTPRLSILCSRMLTLLVSMVWFPPCLLFGTVVFHCLPVLLASLLPAWLTSLRLCGVGISGGFVPSAVTSNGSPTLGCSPLRPRIFHLCSILSPPIIVCSFVLFVGTL